MSGPKNTVINDPTPFLPPTQAPKEKRPTVSDWARIGKSRKYKAVDAQFEARKEYWRHFTPDGTVYTTLAIKDPESAMRFAAIASEVIKEIDDIQYRILLETQK